MTETAAAIASPSRRPHKRVGPYSRQGALAMLDGRSKEAMFMRRVRAELTAHVGGKPSAVERQLIERAVRLSLALELMDERLTHGAAFGAHDHNSYLAWSNSLGRTLRLLGLKPTPKPAPTLQEIAAQIAAEKASAAA
jgi:hypothetical protein